MSYPYSRYGSAAAQEAAAAAAAAAERAEVEVANRVLGVDSFPELRSLATQPPEAQVASLMSGARSGSFRWESSDMSSLVSSDEVTSGEGDGGIYVAPSSDKTGASGAWVRYGYESITPSMYGAEGGGSDDTASLVAMAASAPEGASISINKEILTSQGISAKNGQSWYFNNKIKLSDGGQVVISLFNASNTTGVTLYNPLLDMDFENNTYDGLPGTQHTLSAYKCDLVVQGGVIQNAFDNHVQGSTGDVKFYGTRFLRSGEHCVYLATGDFAPTPPSETSWEFHGCEFYDPSLLLEPTEGHYIQVRSLSGVKVFGGKMHGKNALTPRFLMNATNSNNILFSGVTIDHVNHRLLSLDADCSGVKIENCSIDRKIDETVTGILSDLFVNNLGGVVKITSSTIKGFSSQSTDANCIISGSEITGIPYRWINVGTMEIKGTKIGISSASDSLMAVQATSGTLRMRDCEFEDEGAANLLFFASNSGDGVLDVDGITAPGFTTKSLFRIYPGTATSAHSIKGISMPSGYTAGDAVRVNDSAGTVVLGGNSASGASFTIGTGNTIVDYGNLLAAPIGGS